MAKRKRTIILKKPKSLYLEKEEKMPPDIVYLEDRSLHGWLDKQSKHGGYFSSWKRVFVAVEHLKLRYYKDQKQCIQKGVIDFTRIKS